MILQEVTDFREFYNELNGEIVDHFEYCEPEKSDDFGVSIDVAQFQTAIDAGVLAVFKLLEEDTENFVGYIGASVVPNLIVEGQEYVSIDYLYIAPEYRTEGFGSLVIETLETVFADEGIENFNIQMPNRESSEKMMESLGYTKTGSTFYKKLEEKE